MTPLLTDEQRQALYDAKGCAPVKVMDPATNTPYVLVRADLYDRCKALFEDEEFDVREAYSAMDEVARAEGWDDPEMDVYDQLDPRRTP